MKRNLRRTVLKLFPRVKEKIPAVLFPSFCGHRMETIGNKKAQAMYRPILVKYVA